MVKRPVTPALRKRRIFRDALLLAIVLVVLAFALDFPILTANQALKATQARFFFGPGQVITTLDYPRSFNTAKMGQYDRYYILRWGEWYAWCGVNHYGLFWQTGGLDAVENNPELPLVPLVVSDWADGAVLVISNDPEISRVEISFPAASDEGGYILVSAGQEEETDGCFLVPFGADTHFQYLYALQVRGYNGQGNLVYQSPVHEDWADYGLSPEE